MERKEIIEQYCRYYNGTNANVGYFENWERVWVDMQMNKSEALQDSLEEYIYAGLSRFSETDDTPISLKALLFNRYCKSSSDSMINNVESFKKWYKEKYMGRK